MGRAIVLQKDCSVGKMMVLQNLLSTNNYITLKYDSIYQNFTFITFKNMLLRGSTELCKYVQMASLG